MRMSRLLFFAISRFLFSTRSAHHPMKGWPTTVAPTSMTQLRGNFAISCYSLGKCWCIASYCER